MQTKKFLEGHNLTGMFNYHLFLPAFDIDLRITLLIRLPEFNADSPSD